MREITSENAAEYVRERGRVPADIAITVRELAGGVSNVVLRVDVQGQPPLVIKQCRERLRVAMEWRARLDRIWAERATLEVLASILPSHVVPRVLFEDRANFLFGMKCAPDDSVTWKSLLMAGHADPPVAARLGTLLGRIHARGYEHALLKTTLADASLFEELRIDPYYRTIARAHPRIAAVIDGLIGRMRNVGEARTLVLGDFSPKNILVHGTGLVLLDFECGHAGDAAFDLGFFLSHLVLKAIHRDAIAPGDGRRYLVLAAAFWKPYLEQVSGWPSRPSDLVPRGLLHTAACLLARVDGKSPVEYLDAAGRDRAREVALALLEHCPEEWEGIVAVLHERGAVADD